MLRRAPYFPDAFVGLVPAFFQMLEKGDADCFALRRRFQPALACLGQHIGQLAIDIELELLHRGVADADWPGIAVASKV